MRSFDKFNKIFRLLPVLFAISLCSWAQNEIQWSKDGSSYYVQKDGGIVQISLPGNLENVLVTSAKLIPAGNTNPLSIRKFSVSYDHQEFLIYTNSKKVWRYDTR